MFNRRQKAILTAALNLIDEFPEAFQSELDTICLDNVDEPTPEELRQLIEVVSNV